MDNIFEVRTLFYYFLQILLNDFFILLLHIMKHFPYNIYGDFMRICDLFPSIRKNTIIKGISSSSKRMESNFIFIPLYSKDTKSEIINRNLTEAIEKGATLYVTDKYIFTNDITVIVVNNVKKELSRILSIFYPNVKDIKKIAVTGTDGKTSSALFLKHILSKKCKIGYIGTNGIIYANKKLVNHLTTPPLDYIYYTLNKFYEKGVMYAVIEASSQGIMSDRLSGITFDYIIFTNLSHEHLDSHKTMEEYFKTKCQLFKSLKKDGLLITNIDDFYGQRIPKLSFLQDTKIVTFGTIKEAMYRFYNITSSSDALSFDLETPTKIIEMLNINRKEIYNIYNLIPSVIIAEAENIKIEKIRTAASSLPKVDGRMEKIDIGEDYNVYIDFAHTPNALSTMLKNVKENTTGNVIIVCGAAGGKDKSKRPLMGEAATSNADYVYFTSEDPRDEDPNEILNDLTVNITKHNYEKILDRKSAIKKAILNAKKGDTIIVSGKGRETTYEEKGVIYKYSDVDTIINALN